MPLSSPLPPVDTAPRYVVKNEHTLGLLDPGLLPGFMAVVQGDVLAGGHDWKNGPTVYGPLDTLRPATVADFARFRVLPPPGFGA
jgi:hypothetical protein